MRIVLDLQACQTSGSRFRGIGRSTWAFTRAMLKRGSRHEFRVMLNGAFPDSLPDLRRELRDLVPPSRIHEWEVPGPTAAADPANAWRSCSGEVLREAFVDSLQPDWLHMGSLFEGFGDDAIASVPVDAAAAPVAITLHDLIPWLYPEIYLPSPQAKAWYARRLDSLKRARLLFAVSAHTRREAIDQLDLQPSRIVNVSSSVDAGFVRLSVCGPAQDAVRTAAGIVRPFVMYTGGVDRHKNVEGLVRAFAGLPVACRTAHQLVLVGKASDADRERLVRLARQAGLRDGDLVLTGFVSDEDLVALYNLCKLFVFPSWHEGFGLPALEAMACGAPVIASNTSSLPEVVGRSDALFDPDDEEAMAGLMSRVLEDAGFRRSLSERGLERAKQFSWDESARRALEAMEAVHEERSARRLESMHAPRPADSARASEELNRAHRS